MVQPVPATEEEEEEEEEEDIVSEMIEIPAGMYGNSRNEPITVPADRRMRVEMRLRASTMRQLVIKANEEEVPVTRVFERMIESTLQQRRGE